MTLSCLLMGILKCWIEVQSTVGLRTGPDSCAAMRTDPAAAQGCGLTFCLEMPQDHTG